ncbi:MAG: zinc ribbon domain-containing protein [Phormidesmis sp. RL_2_1]|nr:zinc ribbon domain-containing protein [Phormidesmis sp. RL_2_1]
MPACPRCSRAIATDTITCPHCQLSLTAHGHPGMPLYRATDEVPLCATCAYDADDTCNFPQRPQAKTCTLYQNIQAPKQLTRSDIYPIPWWRKNILWIGFGLLVTVSLLTALL